jgi:hypothetical protein
MSRPVGRRWPWLADFGGVLLLLVGGFYLWQASWDLARDVALSGDRPVADATVLRLIHNSKGPGISTVDVQFVTADGSPVRAAVHQFRKPAPAVGTTLPVRYNREHPGRYCASQPGPEDLPAGPLHPAGPAIHGWRCLRLWCWPALRIRNLADLAQTGPTPPAWTKLMADRRRKTLVVCGTCHQHIHATPTTPTLT